MTWSATDNFDSYTAGGNLSGAAGGSGWSGDWSAVTGTITTETAPAGGQGGNAARCNSTAGDASYQRSFTDVSAGTASIRMRTSDTSPANDFGVILREGGVGKMYVLFGKNTAGQIAMFDGGTSTYVDIGAFSADTWYTIDIDFDDAAQPNQYRVRIDGGSWTSWRDVNGSAYTNIDAFNLLDENTNTHTSWWDDIKPAAGGGSTAAHGVSKSDQQAIVQPSMAGFAA